jgi:hypothetical protein
MRLLIRFMLIFVYNISWWHWCIYSFVKSRAFKHNNTTQTISCSACMRLKCLSLLLFIFILNIDKSSQLRIVVSDTTCLFTVWYDNNRLAHWLVYTRISMNWLYERFIFISMCTIYTLLFTVYRWTNNERKKRERERNDKLVDASCRLLFSVINFKLNYIL